jgi:hypothetical protein
MVSKMEKSAHYYHLRVRNEAGGTERWLLTVNEVERLRERADKNPEMLLPEPIPAPVIVQEEPQGLLARWLRWVRG